MPFTIEIVYGSELGQSKKVGTYLFNQLDFLYSHQKSIQSFNQSEFWTSSANIVVILLSTTGDGEFPTNAKEGWKKLRNYVKNQNNTCGNSEYIICGFGDSNYRSFCHPAKSLHRLAKRKKFQEALPLTLIDDAFQSEPQINEWLQKTRNFIKTKWNNQKFSLINFLLNLN